MELSLIHYASLVIAIIFSLVPIFLSSKKVRNADDYSVGGRKYGTPMVAGTILGTIIGGSSTVGTAQMAYAKGITAWWVTLGAGIALLLMAFFYAMPLRRSRLTTVSQFLTTEYGRGAGMISSAAVSAGMFFSIIASSITGLHLISGLFGISKGISAGIMLALSLSFVLMGGIKGSGTAGLIKLFLVSISIIAGGIWAFFSIGCFSGLERTFDFDPWLNLYSDGIGDGIYNLTAMIIGVISTQAYVQGIFAAKNLRTAYWGCVSAGICIILVGLPSVMIGLYMRAVHPDILPINALPFFLCQHIPPILGGAGIAAVMFSAVGSVSGLSLGIGTTLSNDFAAGITDSARKLLLNRAIVLLSLAGGAIAALIYYDSLVLKWNYLSMATRGITIFIPLTCLIILHGHFRHSHPYIAAKIDKALSKAGLPAMISALIAAAAWKIIFPHSRNLLFPGLVACTIAIVASVLWQLFLKKNGTGLVQR